MPNIPVPDSRELTDHFTQEVEGVECDVYVYAEANSTLFGLLEWEGRHVRVEVPVKSGGYDFVQYIHDARGRNMHYYFNSVPDFSLHVMDALLRARDWIEGNS